MRYNENHFFVTFLVALSSYIIRQWGVYPIQEILFSTVVKFQLHNNHFIITPNQNKSYVVFQNQVHGLYIFPHLPIRDEMYLSTHMSRTYIVHLASINLTIVCWNKYNNTYLKK